MNCTFEDYIKDVKQMLNCNASEEYKKKYVTYLYTNEQVDEDVYNAAIAHINIKK